MSFLWPEWLPLLGLVPILLGIYIWVLRRRGRFAVRYSSLSLVRQALPRPSRLRRHLPFALLLIGLTSLLIATSRPVGVVEVPTGQTTIILAMDVSRSMCSRDIAPSRLEAAQAAALAFVENQRPGARIGIVAFSGFAELIQPPTDDPELLQSAIESLLTGRRTAIGSAIIRAIDAIAEVDPGVAPVLLGPAAGPGPEPLPDGVYVPEIVVLLTDGASNAGPSPLAAAQMAADRGLRVYTIGFGTANGSSFPRCGQQFVGSEPSGGLGPPFGMGGFGGGGGGGGGFRRGIDEATLKRIAELTDGAYFSAESAGELNDVFATLPTTLITKNDTFEVTVAFAALGALLAGIALVLALLWHPLP